jgi:hypothetical protein
MMCPRGDLNPETGEISPIMDLNSKTGEKSPDRGVHAGMVAGMPRLASSKLRRLTADPGCQPPNGVMPADQACGLRHAYSGAWGTGGGTPGSRQDVRERLG